MWTAVLTGALVSTGLWLHAKELLDETHGAFVSNELMPLATALRENQRLLQELQSESFSEKDAGILGSYLVKIRRDGVVKHADMKQRLDTLAENNMVMVTLIKTYAPHARTPAFVTETDKLRNYAAAWRDRWNSVMEIFMAGGNYAVVGVPYPSGIAAAIDAEIAAAK